MRHILRYGGWLTLSLLAGSVQAGQVNVTCTSNTAVMTNARLSISYDLAKGTYEAWDKRRGVPGLSAARSRVNNITSDRTDYQRTASCRDVADGGKLLAIRCTGAGQPTLLLEFTLQPDKPFFILNAGVENTGTQPLLVKEISPLTGAVAFPDDGQRTEVRTLDGFGGSGPTRVTSGASRISPNNLLLTFLADHQRRSLVMGGLTYHEFCKFASTGESSEELRRRDLDGRLGGQAQLAAYLDCGMTTVDERGGRVQLRQLQGQPYVWSDAGVDPCFASVTFDYKEIVFDAQGLDPAKTYLLGWSWWDFDDNGRVESIVAVGADGQRHVLLEKQALPARHDSNRPPHERAIAIPKEMYSNGHVRILFTNDKGRSNAVVSELWLWEGRGCVVPEDWAAGKPASVKLLPDVPGTKIATELKSADPVGKRVDPGKSYLGDEQFYVDFVTADPFTALEQYGLNVRSMQKAAPSIYDFPTSCGWYVGLFEWPQAHNYPERSKYLAATTKGLVEETQQAADSSFLKYSRMAVRVVPDKYEEMEPKGVTQGGWWDDDHWAKYGHYLKPYETTQKYCQGVRARGGLPFTYFQCIMEDREFRLTHTDLLLHKNINHGLDYSNPRTQEYMRKVYARLREGCMAGMMFDYADGFWRSLVSGGFEDPYATAGSVYRTLFALAKEGLGPISWIHERVLGDPYSDITAGVVDSQRTWGDNSQITPEMVSRSGLRWYKSRVLFSYDMDAKNLLHGWKRPGYAASDQDGRRMLLTMAYVAASRLLLSTSYRDMPPEVLFDLERTFPYHTAPQSARPVDMLVCKGWPKVYDFAVTPQWHQVTFFNNDDPSRELSLAVNLSGDMACGSLGLDASQDYYAYDFWNDCPAGQFKGTARLTQILRPGEARMLSIHQVEPNPQFLSTSRHLMQGYLDLPERPAWDASQGVLRGTSRVVGGETYKLVLACNGFKPVSATADDAVVKIKPLPGSAGLVQLTVASPHNADIHWTMRFER